MRDYLEREDQRNERGSGKKAILERKRECNNGRKRQEAMEEK